VPIIGYIGAIFRRDAKLMAQAFDQVRKVEPEAQLLLIGYCDVDVGKLIDAPEAVKRTGRIDYDQISYYLSACDVCWLPMRDSGANQGRSPLKVKDYMAAGRPVVMTAVGDAVNLIRRGKFGLLASDRPDEIANQVLALLRAPERREVMGRRARQLAETEFGWNRIADRLEHFYQQVIEGP
jgi:glycosyltransferase involved in cell wall biosynthesis